MENMQNDMLSGKAQERPKSKGAHRGFAAMDAEKQRQIASKGGREAHLQGTAHEWTSAEAREAGRKGGKASHTAARRAQQNHEQESLAPESAQTENATQSSTPEDRSPFMTLPPDRTPPDSRL